MNRRSFLGALVLAAGFGLARGAGFRVEAPPKIEWRFYLTHLNWSDKEYAFGEYKEPLYSILEARRERVG